MKLCHSLIRRSLYMNKCHVVCIVQHVKGESLFYSYTCTLIETSCDLDKVIHLGIVQYVKEGSSVCVVLQYIFFFEIHTNGLNTNN